METTLRIQTVGYYAHPIADPSECERCGNASFGDVIIEGICGACLLEVYESVEEEVRSL